ncbi:PIPK domain-containing protein [Caenorhabditis elegans]|uniref:PIPK domain-containing protein n=1 Tax=Caenorhabditis elegans TaxID=6239 RepID=I2FLU4_CAEEL|nr:PIPK domain-containing protein [Caenorhabditis elegans]CCE71909.2 PIPK domain-containing protein [Caenorhabditis elegans]|eukprot:NP_001263939.1 Uncharacterized protein CELE_Y43F8B.7 [Caenorhabditis elegans]
MECFRSRIITIYLKRLKYSPLLWRNAKRGTRSSYMWLYVSICCGDFQFWKLSGTPSSPTCKTHSCGFIFWTNTHLLGDQLRYTIMDTIGMYLIIKQRLRNIHKNDPRLFQYVFENGHPLPYNR